MALTERVLLVGTAIICLALIILPTTDASASFVPKVEVEQIQDGTAYLLVNSKRAIHFMKPVGGLSQAARAKIVAGRLAKHLESGMKPEALSSKQYGKSAHVMAGGSLLFMVTKAEAKAHNSYAKPLAEFWVRRLKDLLKIPPLKASPSKIIIPLGETRRVKVESLQDNPIEALVSDFSIVAVDGKTTPGALIITGLAVGDAKIEVRCAECKVVVEVSVRKYAAYLASKPGRAVVTGYSVPDSLVLREVKDAAARSVNLQPGASLKVTWLPSGITAPEQGKVSETTAEIRASGDGYISTELPVRVEIENRFLSRVDASELMYSNSPERVSKYQVLFTGWTSMDSPKRLVYHHQNMIGKRLGFIIDVQNPGNSHTELHIIEGIAKPLSDTIAVGYRAGYDFLRNYGNGIGRVIELHPGERRILVSQPLDNNTTASGIMELMQLSGDPLLIRVIAKPEILRLADDLPDGSIVQERVNLTGVNISDHVYPNPIQDVEAVYTAGQRWLFIRIGKDHIKHATQNKLLYGNYGVIYNMKIRIENPTTESLPIELAFEATAGPASGVFIVNGKTVPVRYLQHPDEVKLYWTIVPAGKTREIRLRTIPLPGSNYPATIIVRPTRQYR